MADTNLATASTRTITKSSRAVTRKPNALTEATKPRRSDGLTRKIRAAIDAQVFEGLKRAEAAKKAGITDNALYQALRKPAPLAYWNECLQVLRTGERARNIIRLTEIRDQDENRTAAVRAVQVLEEAAASKQQQAGSKVVTPGIQIVINANSAERMMPDQTLIEINPLIDNDAVGNDDFQPDE